MQRRTFLQLSVLAPLALGTAKRAHAAETPAYSRALPDGRAHRFELAGRQFLLDGKPFWIRSGEMHPIRIPAEYWRHRIRMARAMGLNTISLYLMWNALEREPGEFDFESGNRDFVRFIRLCQDEGMWVYLRPGPYICGEWDYGGLPPYLLRTPGIRVRDRRDPHYMAAVHRYMDALAPRIAPLMASRGGPVLMVQVENEYASFGHDLGYLERLRSMWRERGVEGPFSISDGLGQIRKQHTYLSGAALGLDGDTDFAGGQAIAGEMPVWMGEGYPGWLTHWGDKSFAGNDFIATLRQLLAERRSFNLYVVHGGTNFGFGAGANAHGDYSHFEPVITSYDYGAPIDERGVATPAYHRFRALLAPHADHRLPDVPHAAPAIRFAAVTAVPHASLWDNLPAPKAVTRPQPNELLFAQDHGMVMYRKRLDGGGHLSIDGVRDYATVFHDGHYLDRISRVRKAGLPGERPLAMPAEGGTLDILVDSFGHIGYGQAMVDRKGIVGSVQIDGRELRDWQAYSLSLEPHYIAALQPLRDPVRRPGVFFRAELLLDEPGDSYLDMSAWDKGYLWVNGHLLGRYWSIGPQQRLYCPASWFRPGRNELLVFDMHRTEGAPIQGVERLHD
ncbi:beta-galactosidase [Dyella sp. A6]|uniref:beta-galactosidase n=1 Tax=Dyella aluminiiresistens TaxID=3069105 RepID=UPI002E793F7D|nr:beta-galactosidase [Dyella sp. A6]